MQRRLLIVALMFTVTGTVLSQNKDNTTPAPRKSWQVTAAEYGLSPTEIELLEKNDLLLTNHEYRQIYQAYSPHPHLPLFITSDSLLNAYHVLLEESFVRMENSRVPRLAETLRMILTNLEQPRLLIQDQPELNTLALRRARIVIGVAVRLLDSSFRFDDAELNEIVATEAARVEAAKDEHLPDWLGSPSRAFKSIHYDRFKPRSFYTQSVHLERYFRAVSWLQAIPFRIKNDDELLAILMLGKTLNVPSDANWSEDEEHGFDIQNTSPDEDPYEKSLRVQETFRYFYPFVGHPDLPDIVEAADQVESLWMMSSGPEMPDEASTDDDTTEDTDVSEPSEKPGNLNEESSDDASRSSDPLERAEEIDPTGNEKTTTLRGQFGTGRGSGGLLSGSAEPRALNWNDLKQFRESLRDHLLTSDMKAQINDQDRLPPDDPEQVDDLQFRVISASRTPDGILFQRTTDARRFRREFPSGLEIPIALGSAAARTYLNDPWKEQVLQEIESCRSLFHAETLYGSWLHALASLLDDPDYDAPAFMRGDGWQRKSCNTVLASWAQQRHTLALHAKINAGYGGFATPPPGFVEPDPEFFSRMAELAQRTKQTFRDGDLKAIPPDCRPLIPVLKSIKGLARDVADSTSMKISLKKGILISNMSENLARRTASELSAKTEFEQPYREYWNQQIDQELHPAKLAEVRNLATGISDARVMKTTIEGLFSETRDDLPPEDLLFDLLDLAKIIPQKSSSWSDHWSVVCDEHLPKVRESVIGISEGINNQAEMLKIIEKRWDWESLQSKYSVTQLVLKRTSKTPDPSGEYSDLWDEIIDQLIQQIEDDTREKDPDLTAILDTGHPDLSPLWDELVATSLRLEVIAHKQLRGVDLNGTESSFLLTYNQTLATIMLRSEHDSVDDAPWAIGVYTNHLLGKTLHAATSRPRILYVLYPWSGTKVLTRGAVVPYREVISASPLTDQEWRGQLDTGCAPPLPDWLQPILSPADLPRNTGGAIR